MDGIDVPYWAMRPIRFIGRIVKFGIKKIVTISIFAVFGFILFFMSRMCAVKIVERVME